MLKNRRFNVVLVTKDAPRALDLDSPEGKIVSYTGKATTISL
jgi:alpha-D-xyloside xylohydrolase